ncbi:DUF1266 domain-containing protein [Streptomyces sp. NPDC001985]|uniref:DUF1266 domain-containing protein n=1 Tax=Streptomyces sp. NPDC001985 TaxID=3154406 RepID=UPI00331CFD25
MTTGTGTGTGADTGWVPPTEVERRLREAHARGSRDELIDALSRSRLYVLTARLHADTPGFTPPPVPAREPSGRRMCLPVLTAGMLPPWHPEWVFRQTSLAELARTWPDNRWRLGVNHGTPGAIAVDARPRRRREWLAARVRSGGPARIGLLTHGGGPLHGPLAHGLAVGAHLAVLNGLVWNQLGTVYEEYALDIARLEHPWRIGNRAGYEQVLSSLMATRLIGRTHESALRLRRSLAARLGRTPSSAEWREAAALDRARRGVSDADAAESEEALGRIEKYEELLRAEGVLAPGARVDSLAAFDHGRAVNVVRLALGARYCDPAQAEQSVLRIGALARQAYGSWEEFALGYALARLIHFDDEDASGTVRRETLAQHRVLTRDPAGPYRNIPWS